MNTNKLIQAINNRADTVLSGRATQEDKQDVKELLHVLARIVGGKPIHLAFGAPGDWGYETPIGDALNS